MSAVNLTTDFDINSLDKYIFISCVSFEERTKTIPSWISSSKHPPTSACLFFNRFHKPLTSNTLDILENYFACEVTRYEIRNGDPLFSADQFINCINFNYNHFGKTDYFIDVTTFTREWIFILLAALKSHSDKIKRIFISYNPASSMSPSWLSKGAKSFRTVLGYPGNILPSKKNHLVLILGHEFERASSIIELCDPHTLSIGVGSESASINKEMWALNVEYLQQLKTYYSFEINEFTLDLVNPFHSRDNLKSHISKYGGLNTIIAPLNTKMSSVGACLLALADPSIQLCYLQVEFYNTSDYSKPSKNIIAYDIKL